MAHKSECAASIRENAHRLSPREFENEIAPDASSSDKRINIAIADISRA